MKDTKTEILDLAENLIRSKGYHAFSYADISGPLKIKNAAIHYHFPSKGDLGKAIIERTHKRFEEETKTWIHLNLKKQFNNFLKIYQVSDSQNLVCFMGALGPAYDSLPEQMQESLTQAAEEIRRWLQQLLRKGKEEQVFHFNERVEEKADMIVSSLLASLILNRVTHQNIWSSVNNAIRSNI